MPEKMRTERGSLCGPDVHGDSLHRVVRVALQVPGGLQWLGVARRVGGARAQHVLAGPGVPLEAPPAPGGVAERLVEQGRREGRAGVGGDLDTLDLTVAGPHAARE